MEVLREEQCELWVVNYRTADSSSRQVEEAEDCRDRGTKSGTEPPVSLRLQSALCTTLSGSLGIYRRCI